MIIQGTITNKNGDQLDDVNIMLMNSQFEEVASTLTDENGEYSLLAPDDHYPFLVAVKNYKKDYLEFWCQNIDTTKDITINGSIGRLEIYGLHCFRIKGAYPALTLYFRPMSLDKFNNKEDDISPDITDDSINISINNENSTILNLNKVKEYAGEMNLTAYLIQVSLPRELLNENENFLTITIRDNNGDFGQASIFF